MTEFKFPTPEIKKEYDVCVVGGGVAGVAAALLIAGGGQANRVVGGDVQLAEAKLQFRIFHGHISFSVMDLHIIYTLFIE